MFTEKESQQIYSNFLAIVNDKKRRDKLVKKHGSKAEAVAYGTAVNQVRKKADKRKSKEDVLDKLVKDSLSKPLQEKNYGNNYGWLVEIILEKLKNCKK